MTGTRGSPAAAAWASTNSRRTACIATRSNSIVERGQEADDFEVELLAKDVQSPCAILAGTPGEQDSWVDVGHGRITGLGIRFAGQDSLTDVPSPPVALLVLCTSRRSPTPPLGRGRTPPGCDSPGGDSSSPLLPPVQAHRPGPVSDDYEHGPHQAQVLHELDHLLLPRLGVAKRPEVVEKVSG